MRAMGNHNTGGHKPKDDVKGGKKNVHSLLNYTDIIFALGEDDEGLGRIQRTSQDNCIKHCSSEDT